jgi:uncharacterized membrane protein YphA (DoxX/SURF4 family)
MPDWTHHGSVRTAEEHPAHPRAASAETAPHAQAPDAPQRARRLRQRHDAIESAVHAWLVAHSIQLLRISLGLVFLGFGALKFFPGVSPAENLVVATTSALTFGLVPGSAALVAVAVLECVIGLWLLSGRALRGAIYLLVIELIGILAPIVLLGDRLFSGPHNAPTLQGQYVLKDVILVAAVLVVAATVRGGRMTSAKRGKPRTQASRATRQADSEASSDRTERRVRGNAASAK